MNNNNNNDLEETDDLVAGCLGQILGTAIIGLIIYVIYVYNQQ